MTHRPTRDRSFCRFDPWSQQGLILIGHVSRKFLLALSDGRLLVDLVQVLAESGEVVAWWIFTRTGGVRPEKIGSCD